MRIRTRTLQVQTNTGPYERDPEDTNESLSVFILELILRERLLEIIHPCRVSFISICVYVHTIWLYLALLYLSSFLVPLSNPRLDILVLFIDPPSSLAVSEPHRARPLPA